MSLSIGIDQGDERIEIEDRGRRTEKKVLFSHPQNVILLVPMRSVDPD